MPEVEFRDTENGEPCHKYYRDGKEIPGLSYILESNGFCRYGKVRKDVMEAARERGDAAHYATRLFDEDNPSGVGNIDQWQEQSLKDSLDPWTLSRLKGWVKFRIDFDFNPLIIEKPMCHEWSGMVYAMTPDRYGNSSMGRLVPEIKCTAEIEPSCQIQTAFQIQPFKMETDSIRRVVVQLLENDYKIHEFKDRQDERLAFNILGATSWKWAMGIR